MTNTAANVRVGVTGKVYYAPLATSLPTSLTAATTSFSELGYINEDGITEAQSTDTNQVKAWQNGDIVRVIQTSHELSYAFTMLETSTAVQTVFYGGDPTIGTPMHIAGTEPVHYAWIIDVTDGTHDRRICIPDGQITERGDVVYSGNDPVQYEVTMTCYPDTSGYKAYVYED